MKEGHDILMIEDSATDAALAVRVFKRAKITNPLVVATTGGEGFDYLMGTGIHAGQGPGRPALILLDLKLPDMTGLDCLRRLKKDPRTRAIPVVVLSLSGTVPAILEATRLGAEHYLVKPVDFDNFLRVATLLKLKVTLQSPGAAGGEGR